MAMRDPQKSSGKIKIDNIKNECYRKFGDYSSFLYSCDLILKTFWDKELLGKYKCIYTLKEKGGKPYIEFPDKDVLADFECTAPSDWSFCTVTEQFLNEDFIIKSTFNAYKRLKSLHNRKLYDVVTLTIFL